VFGPFEDGLGVLELGLKGAHVLEVGGFQRGGFGCGRGDRAEQKEGGGKEQGFGYRDGHTLILANQGAEVKVRGKVQDSRCKGQDMGAGQGGHAGPPLREERVRGRYGAGQTRGSAPTNAG